MGRHIPNDEIKDELKETFELRGKLIDLRDHFSELHARHVEALREGKLILAREFSNEAIATLATVNAVVDKAPKYFDSGLLKMATSMEGYDNPPINRTFGFDKFYGDRQMMNQRIRSAP